VFLSNPNRCAVFIPSAVNVYSYERYCTEKYRILSELTIKKASSNVPLASLKLFFNRF